MKALTPSPKSVLRKISVDDRRSKPDSENQRTPLEIMLRNARFYDQQADRLLKQLKRLIVRTDDPRSRDEAQETLQQFLAMRDKSQAAARDAAPFCHARVALTQESPLQPERRIEPIDWDNVSPEQAALTYQRLCQAGRRR